eukprot:1155472-Pelagomonas_calceolata.AAC.1
MQTYIKSHESPSPLSSKTESDNGDQEGYWKHLAPGPGCEKHHSRKENESIIQLQVVFNSMPTRLVAVTSLLAYLQNRHEGGLHAAAVPPPTVVQASCVHST